MKVSCEGEVGQGERALDGSLCVCCCGKLLGAAAVRTLEAAALVDRGGEGEAQAASHNPPDAPLEPCAVLLVDVEAHSEVLLLAERVCRGGRRVGDEARRRWAKKGNTGTRGGCAHLVRR